MKFLMVIAGNLRNLEFSEHECVKIINVHILHVYLVFLKNILLLENLKNCIYVNNYIFILKHILKKTKCTWFCSSYF